MCLSEITTLESNLAGLQAKIDVLQMELLNGGFQESRDQIQYEIDTAQTEVNEIAAKLRTIT